MRERRGMGWTLLWTLACACQGASTPHEASDASGARAPTTSAAAAHGATLDPAQRTRVEALRRHLQRAAAPCATLLRAVSPDQAAQAPLPFDRDALDAACGDAGRVYDEDGQRALKISRGATRLAEAAARLGDDLDYLRRAMNGPPSERRNAIEHLHAALNTVDERLAEPPSVYETPYAYPPSADAGLFAPTVENDATELDACARSLRNLVYEQGFDPASVRRRLLEVRGAAVLADLDARDATLLGSPSLQPEARADLQAAAARTRAAVETFEAAWRAFAAGEVTTPEGRDAWRAKTDAAFRAAGRTPP